MINKQVQIVSNRDEVLKVAAAFYENLYKSTLSDEEQKSLCPNMGFDDDNFEQVTNEEVQVALMSMKNSKSPGCDRISWDLFKICNEIGLSSLSELFNEILTSEEILNQWLESTIILITKNGDWKKMTNYRSSTSESSRLPKRLFYNW